MSNIKVDTIKLPAHWASFYINGDASGLSTEEYNSAIQAEWLIKEDFRNARIVSCAEETFIGHYNNLLTEMVEYTFHYDTPAGEPAAPVEQYRIMIVEDSEEYNYADETDEQREATREAIDQHGVWGFVVERQVPCTSEEGDCGEPHWEHVDSCFGFIGGDGGYIMSEALASIPEGYGKVSVVDENGREINKVVRK